MSQQIKYYIKPYSEQVPGGAQPLKDVHKLVLKYLKSNKEGLIKSML